MAEPKVVASRYALWQAAIKWPMYSVAVMPAFLAAGALQGLELKPRWEQLILFLLAAVLLLAWENLSNDVFDADTGVDSKGKPHSVVNLSGRRDRVALAANCCLLLGLALMALVAQQSHAAVLLLVLACCGIGYLYQGPPFRLSYRGLGEPLCWLAFGPLASAAALIALAPAGVFDGAAIPWSMALQLGAGPAVATSLVLFCSHFHQVEEDAKNGKNSPVVQLGSAKAAALVPWFVVACFALQWLPILRGIWPPTAFLGLIGLAPALSLIRLLQRQHNQPERIIGCKFLALRFQALNGLGLALGLALGPLFLGH
ncbi:MAG: 2-carboxy-1,4-naphthoquinone phytyltransferase [Synechococcus sp. SupBloom_Metag_053]|nr:2-carboxy-1,4-naphthoquinone phytyltransferase [Synechococcus sp. SupBloom_Metag_053]